MSIQNESARHSKEDTRINVDLKNNPTVWRKIRIKISIYRIILFGRILKFFFPAPYVMSSEETLKYILSNHCSIGRVGDGEMDIMIGVWWQKTFQKFNRRLSHKLRKLKSTEHFLLCLPDVVNTDVLSLSYITKQEYDFWKTNIHQYGGYWRYLGRGNQKIGNAFLSRFYIRYQDKTGCSGYVELLRQLWYERDIIIVEGKKTKSGIGNDLYQNARSVHRILCPETNAFESYDVILKACKQYAFANCLFLLALGQTATVLAKDLSDEGYQALDIGHMDIEYEWFLSKTDVKIPVKNKYVKEAVGGDNPDEYYGKDYEEQVLVSLD